MIYRKIGNAELDMEVYYPKGWNKEDLRPSMVLFFGGGWSNGEPKQFKKLAEHFTGKGFVIFTPEYRIQSIHNTTPYESVEDAKAAAMD